MTQHPDEGTLHAFIDGELPRVEAADLELHVAACAQCASALAEARGLTAAASRVVNALDVAPTSASRAAAPAVPVRQAPVRRSRSSYFRAPYLQAAAVLLLAAGSAVVIDRSRSTGEPVAADMALEADAASPAMDETAALSTMAPEQSLKHAAPVAPRVAVGTDAAGKRTVQQTSGVTQSATGAANVSQPTASEAAPAVAPQRMDVAADRKEFAAPAAAPPSALASGRISAPTSDPSTRTTRYRLESGAVLTLVDEPLDSVEARQRAAATRRTERAAARAMAPLSAEPAAANSYRWVDTQQRRAYLLSGPVSEEALKAAAIRLGDLQRLP